LESPDNNQQTDHTFTGDFLAGDFSGVLTKCEETPVSR
jgi:hypothetical protein